MRVYSRKNGDQGKKGQEAEGQRLFSLSEPKSAGIISILMEWCTYAEAGWAFLTGAVEIIYALAWRDDVKVAGNPRLLMLHTSMSAKGETSLALWPLKSSVLSPGLQDSRRECRRRQGQWNKMVSLSSIHSTELCAAKTQWEQRALDSGRKPQFNLASASFQLQ